MIDIRKLKELVKLMVENDLSELDLRDQQETVTVKRGAAGVPVYVGPPHASGHGAAASAGAAHAPHAAASNGSSAAEADGGAEGLVAIESPMVGTFYVSPTPDADAYVTAGSGVSNGSVVCIIEAMKVFNEIKSDVDGVVERVLVQNGDAVEFGQKLFLVRPS